MTLSKGDPPPRTQPVGTGAPGVATPAPDGTAPTSNPGPPGGVGAGRKRRARGEPGLLIGLLAVAVVVLTLGIAFLAWGRSDDEADGRGGEADAGRSAPTTEVEAPPGGLGPGDDDDAGGADAGDEQPGGEDGSGPEAGASTVPGTAPSGSGGAGDVDLFLPDVGALPAGFPVPPGGSVNDVGLLEVAGSSVEEVRDFFVAELPGAGFTPGEVQGSSGSWVVPVTGPGVAGNLTITDVPGTVTVLWIPG